MLSNGERIMAFEVREAFARILSVVKVLVDDVELSAEDRRNMADNIEEPLYELAAMIGRQAAKDEFASIAVAAGLDDWRAEA